MDLLWKLFFYLNTIYNFSFFLIYLLYVCFFLFLFPPYIYIVFKRDIGGKKGFDLKESVNGKGEVSTEDGISDLFYDYVLSMINDLYRIRAINIPKSKKRILTLLDYYDEDLGGLITNSGR